MYIQLYIIFVYSICRLALFNDVQLLFQPYHHMYLAVIPGYLTNLNQQWRPHSEYLCRLLADVRPIESEKVTCTCAFQSECWADVRP